EELFLRELRYPQDRLHAAMLAHTSTFPDEWLERRELPTDGRWETAAGLVRCVFGNPFRPPSPRTFPSHVVGLAESCYAALPEVTDQFLILADALDDLGEIVAAAHCRESLHVKGCHLLDWILNKE